MHGAGKRSCLSTRCDIKEEGKRATKGDEEACVGERVEGTAGGGKVRTEGSIIPSLTLHTKVKTQCFRRGEDSGQTLSL